MKEIYNILVVDDEFGMREGVRRILVPYGHSVLTAQDGDEAFSLIEEKNFDLAFIDLKLPDADGLDILDAIVKKSSLTVCIIITAYATLDTAVDATKRGAFDYLAKPFTADQLLTITEKAMDRHDLLFEADRLRKERDLSLLELYQEKTRFKTIISCMTDGVIVTNRDEQVVLFNNMGSLLLKDSNIKPGMLLKDCSVVDDLYEIVKKSEENPEVHMTGKEIEYKDKIWLANCAVLKDEKGGFLGTVTVLRDITEIKEVEKLKSRFISLVAHELKAPVAAIKGYLDIIIKRAAGNDQSIYDNMMIRSRERSLGLLNLIEDLLSMSRLDTKRIHRYIQPNNVNEYLLENLDFFKQEIEKRKIQIINNMSSEPVVALVDKEELCRIITNLLSNAIKYNSENGEIIIESGKNSEKVYFSIKDTGIGLTDSDKARLFEDFFRANNSKTRKESGTGLGLAITKRMIEGNFGKIEVESEYEKGSKFTATLPASTCL